MVYLAPLTLRLPLLDPDEGLHAAIAQEMVERGDWVTPRLLGQPFFDKPILFFWAQAAALSLGGMSEWAVRLPGVVFGLAGALTTGLLARRLADPQVAWLAGIFQITMVLPTALTQAAVHDVALVPWTNLALWSLYEATDPAASPARYRCQFLAAGLWLGLAILTKGLIGVALVGLATLVWLTLRRAWSRRAVLGGAIALALAALVAAPWYLAMELRNPGYLYYYVVERHLLGYVTETQRHGGRVWWYYLPLVAGGGLPWIAFLPATAAAGWKTRRHDPAGWLTLRLVAAWLVSSVTFLSLANSKLLTYLLPAFPAVAILAAWGCDRLVRDEAGSRARRLAGGALWALALVGPAILPITMRVTTRVLAANYSPGIWLAAGLISLGMAWPVWSFLRGRMLTALAAQTAALAAILLFAMGIVLPRIAVNLSADTLAQHVNESPARPDRIWIIEERIGSLVFYLDPDYRRELTPERLRMLAWEDLAKLPPDLGPDVWIALPHKRLKRAHQYLDVARLAGREVGHYRLVAAPDLLAVRQGWGLPPSPPAERLANVPPE